MIYAWMLHNRALTQPKDFDFKAFFDLVSTFAEKHKLKPSFYDLSGDPYPDDVIKSAKALKLLQDNEFEGLTGLGIYLAVPSGEDFAFYWKALIQVRLRNKRGLEFFAGVNESSISAAGLKEELIHPVSGMIDVQYGYSYRKDPEDGPFGYGLGFIHLPGDKEMSEPEKETIVQWNNYGEEIEKGRLRDLFQENLLSKVHLERKMPPGTFKDWIEDHKDDMDLEKFTQGTQLLTVKKQNYAALRTALADEDMLISYDRSVKPTALS
jgi:hypothetical protein